MSVRGWRDLDGQRLRARSPDEWREAYALAKALALKWTRSLGGDVDDVIQEALESLDVQLDDLARRDIAPSRALCRVFFCKAVKALKKQRARDALPLRLPGDLTESLPRPDSGLEERELEAAFEMALEAELDAADSVDVVLLTGMLVGRSQREIAVELDLAESTLSRRARLLRERLRTRLRDLLVGRGPSALLTPGDDKP